MTAETSLPGASSQGWDGIDGLPRVRARLHAWARQRAGIRAAVAFGSTERTDRPADAWSDLDLLLVVDDAAPWLEDLGWVDEIGPWWLRFVHDAPVPGLSVVHVLVAGGYDVDLIPLDAERVDVIRDPQVAAEVFGHGARVLVDHDGALIELTGNDGDFQVEAGTGVRPPTSDAFDQTVSTFLYQT